VKFKDNGVTVEFDEEKLTFAEGRALEKVTGYAFGAISEHGNELSVIQAWVWVALKRSEPSLKFSDLDDRQISDFEFDAEDEEPESPTSGDDGSETGAPSTSSDSSASVTSPEPAASEPGSSTI
jgi:hypothetical protein